MDAIEVNLDDKVENSTFIESDTSQQPIITLDTSDDNQDKDSRLDEQSNADLHTVTNSSDEPEAGQEKVMKVIDAEVTKEVTKKPRLNELDKFKRRLIRAVARLLFEEKKPEDEIWNDLRKETSCDCKLLWTRMCALTIKKLKRLFAADDRLDKITPIARLSVTDWLLFDLVLVHEDVDVIGQEMSAANKKEPGILKDLFQLVVKYKIEYLTGDAQTVAWYSLTSEYNDRGRKCSPMLLQRRWYQMKEQVRSKFYNFWFTYRGHARRLEEADKYKPTDLEMDIVNVFMFIVTQPFKSWEELIPENKVSLPSDFERLQLSKKKKGRTDPGPDLELIEPQVETIDLGVDSDDEDSRDSFKAANDPHNNSNKNVVESENTVSNDGETSERCIKTELIYDICDEDEVSALESMHIPLESNVNTVVETNENNNVTEITESVDTYNGNEVIISTQATTTDVEDLEIDADTYMVEEQATVEEKNQVEFETTDPGGIQDTEISNEPVNSFEMLMPKITSITSTAQLPPITIDDDDDEVHDQINSILEGVANKIVQDKPHNLMSQSISKEQEIKSEAFEKVENKIEIPVEKNIVSNENLFNDVANDLDMIDGIELEDDGIEFFDEDEETTEAKIEMKVEENNDDCVENDDTPKIDLKLLLNPIVYTKKLDDMDVFRFIEYTTIRDRRIIDSATLESKPVDKDSVNMKDISQEFRNSIKSEPICNTDSEFESDDDYERIKTTSWLFRKPRAPSYNPIQLCKNPDFNTRLKWLTVGFFSSQRNRQLLKECKPITIDVNKAFESKLVNSTLYLEQSYFSEAKITPLKSVEKTVVPSELPGHALLYSDVFVNSETNRLMKDEFKPVNVEARESEKNEIKPEVHETKKNEFKQEVFTIERNEIKPEVHEPLRHEFKPEVHKTIRNEIKPEVYEMERNKIINLPDFDQIRRTNKKLLVAEVTPLQIANLVNKPPVTIVQDNARIVQSSKNDNDTETEVTVKDPINSEIIHSAASLTIEKDSSHELRKLIKNNNCNNMNTEKLSYYLKKRLLDNSNKIHNKIQLPKTNYKVRPVNVTWKPKLSLNMERNISNERLLATDTVTRIISICKGITPPLSKKMQKNIPNKRKYNMKSKQGNQVISNTQSQEQVTVNSESVCVKDNRTNIETDTKVCQKIDTKSGNRLHDEINCKNAKITEHNTKVIPKPNRNTYTDSNEDSIKIKRTRKLYCCWAREKMDALNKKIQRVRLRHLCPQHKCICCCSLKYLKILQEKRKSSTLACHLNLISDDENEPSSKDDSVQKLSKDTNNKTKVSIGVNTDFNKDFEECYASTISANIIGIDDPILNEPVASLTTSVENNSSSLWTQTVALMPNIETVSPVISSVRSEISNVISKPPLKPITEDVVTSKQVKPKCKTNIHHGSIYSSILQKEKIATNIQEKKLPDSDILRGATNRPKNSNTVVLLNDKLRNNLFKNPICLGKNKILLCSVKPLSKANMIDVTNYIEKNNLVRNTMIPQYIDPFIYPSQAPPPLIPKGVHLVLLPTQELALSIDPGVELNADQVANIPNILSTVQQQLSVLGVNNIAQNNVANDVIQLSDDENSVEKDKQYKTCSSKEDLEKDISLNEINKSDSSHNVNELIGDRDNASGRQSENIAGNIATPIINHNEENSLLENLESDTHSTNENDMNNMVSESSTTTDVVDDSKDIPENAVEKPKKTILSDLMEMSGISLEDTTITNTETPAKEQPLTADVPALLLKCADVGNVSDEKSESLCGSILYNPFVQSALLKCPDLNIVSSFDELKYVYENDGQFYKMDIETGIIVPINVSIKKHKQLLKSKIKICSKSVIDLTEDDDGKDDNKNSKTEITFEENNTECAMEIDITPESVKPIKLFKAIHPSLLRQKLTQKMKEPTPSKVLKRKKNTNLIFDCEKGKNIEKKESNKQKGINYTDSESDDEPLALKAKRIKMPEEITGENKNGEMSNDKRQENVVSDVVEQNFDEIPTSESNLSENKNEASDTEQIQPLFLKYSTDDSSEEDCILGV